MEIFIQQDFLKTVGCFVLSKYLSAAVATSLLALRSLSLTPFVILNEAPVILKGKLSS